MEAIKNVLTRKEFLRTGGILTSTTFVACGETGQNLPLAVRLQNPYATPRTEVVERLDSLEVQIQGAIEKIARFNLGREQGFPYDIAQLYLGQRSLSTLSPSFGKLSVVWK
ncbi:MAG: hypothetical protein HYU80_04100 [Candidatus Blackburnbacteria bacterium]|nr:hypothetical protein [Candidatus Blackburnbacteria bacterium]